MVSVESFLAEWQSESPLLTVHTSGSTGVPKTITVEKRRMEASARITCSFLGLKEGDTALLCLPLDYIAGKMMVVRALTCGLRLITVPPSSHPLSDRPDGEPSGTAAIELSGTVAFAAMVPMQVYQSLRVPEERRRLSAIRHLIIGGGAVDDALAGELRAMPNAVWSTYGMTETLSHIALRRLSGPEASQWYTPFHGVTLSLTPDQCLVIDAPAVCPMRLVTNDIAELLPDGRFRILGRKDNVICSGGVKIQAEEVERQLKPHLHAPFCITWRSDPVLGQAVVLLTEDPDTAMQADVCVRVLPRLWKPRHIVVVPRIPMTPNGKIARKEAERMVSHAM